MKKNREYLWDNDWYEDEKKRDSWIDQYIKTHPTDDPLLKKLIDNPKRVWYDHMTSSFFRLMDMLDKLDGPIVSYDELQLWDGIHKKVGLMRDKLTDSIRYYDGEMSIYIEDGDLWIKNTHHDGVNHHMLRKLTIDWPDLVDAMEKEGMEKAFMANTESLVSYLKFDQANDED